MSRPFAGNSEAAFPAKVIAGDPIVGRADLRDSLGQLTTAATHTDVSKNLQVTIQSDGWYIEDVAVKKTVKDNGSCVISCSSPAIGKVVGKVRVSTMFRSHHLLGSPSIVEITTPPWAFAPLKTSPSNLASIVSFTCFNRVANVAEVTQREQSRGVSPRRGMEVTKPIQEEYVHVFGSSELTCDSSPEHRRWQLRFESHTASASGAGIGREWAVGVIESAPTTACGPQHGAQQMPFQHQGMFGSFGVAERTNTVFSATTSSTFSFSAPIPASATTASSMSVAAGMWNDGSIIPSPPANCHSGGFVFDGLLDNSNWQQDVPAGVSWSSGHNLELELTSTNRLTIRNLSTDMSHTLVMVPRTCVPVIMIAARQKSSSTVSLNFDT